MFQKEEKKGNIVIYNPDRHVAILQKQVAQLEHSQESMEKRIAELVQERDAAREMATHWERVADTRYREVQELKKNI